MNLRHALLVSAATLLGIAGAPDSFAERGGAHAGRAGHGGGARHHAHYKGGHSGGRYAASHRARVAARTAYWGAPLAYGPATYSSYYAPASTPAYAPPPAAPALYYVPPIAANAPPFSFDGSPAVEPDWGWQRVNLQQLAAEVRAKREAGTKP